MSGRCHCFIVLPVFLPHYIMSSFVLSPNRHDALPCERLWDGGQSERQLSQYRDQTPTSGCQDSCVWSQGVSQGRGPDERSETRGSAQAKGKLGIRR